MLGDRDRGGRGAQDRFREDDRQYRNTHEDRWASRDAMEAATRRSQRNFASHQDDHYRSWRDRQMEALDRDYEEYCREREQQFHRDFDSWRQPRAERRPARSAPAMNETRC